MSPLVMGKLPAPSGKAKNLDVIMDQKLDFGDQPYSPRRGRSRSRTPKRRSPSPRSRSHSRNSDKSSSDRSRRSSSSKSSSSNPSIVESSKRKSRKEKKTRSKDKRASLQTTGEDDSKETSLSGGGEPNSKAETSKDWQDISYDTSPIAQHSPERAPTLKSSVQSVVVRRSPRPNPLQKSPPSPQGGAPPSGSSFRALSRQSPFDHNTSGMSPPKKAPLSKTSPTISSLYGNPKDEGRPGDAGQYSKSSDLMLCITTLTPKEENHSEVEAVLEHCVSGKLSQVTSKPKLLIKKHLAMF
ncbi:thyroid hormone receptor-associated protein 3-like [Lissotriton helveticus]